MRKKINQLAKGVFDEKQPVLVLPPAPLTESVICGKSLTGCFTIRSRDSVPFRGLIYADDDRIELLQTAFAGQSFEISYVVHGEDVSEDVVLEGCFSLVTNGGDVKLPYRFGISHLSLSRAETPQTVEELATLAKEKPEVMLSLFESDAFIDLPFFKEDSLRALYRALRKSPDRRLALEEFLVSCGAKKPVKLTVDAAPQTYIVGPDREKGEIFLQQSGEGYCLVRVTSRAPFIRLARERFSSFDFTDGTLTVPFQIQPGRLHEGRNYGEIAVSNGREEWVISVTAMPEREAGPERVRLGQYRRSHLKLTGLLFRLYAGQKKPAGLDAQVLKYMDACDLFQEAGVPERLLRAEVYRQMRRRDEEKETLEQIRATVQRSRTENVTQYLWFLYLEEEMEKGNRLSDSFLRLLYRLKDEEAGKAELLPLLMRSDSEWAEQPEKCFLRAREHFRRGPLPLMLQIEMILLLNAHPELLVQIDAFTRWLLLLGARFGCWKPEVAERAAALLIQEKAYRPGNERILRLMYEDAPDKNLLTALLSVVLRRGEALPQYHELYEQGIREDVRLAELYEYYLATLPEDAEGELPQMVLLYYTYNSPQTVKARLVLYSYILQRYEPDTQLYRLYEKQIQDFALEQLLQGAVSEPLGFIYEKMFIPEVVEAKTASILSELIYTVHLKLSNPDIVRILVLYGELKEEYAYAVKNREAFLPVFTGQCRLIFVDKNGLRYSQNVFKRKRLMNVTDELAKAVQTHSPDSLPFRLMLCRRAVRGSLSEAEALEVMRRYVSWDALSDLFRERLIFSLVRRHDFGDAESETLLKTLKNSPYLDAKAGSLLAENFLARGDDEAAVEMVHRFGYRHFDPELLLKLMNRQIRKNAYVFDRSLFDISLSLYRSGSWDSVTLTYLCRYFNGGTDEMRQLLSRAESGEALYYDLPERLLGQMLFTGGLDRIEWVVDLYVKGTKTPNRSLLHAYAAVQSERYFCREEAVPDNLFAYLASWAASEKRPEQLPLICQMALTKYDSEQESLKPEQIRLAQTLLYHLYDEGKFFVYQQALGRFFPLPAELADKTLIEYRGDEEVPVRLGLRILPQEADEDYTYSEMPHIFRGIYVRQVLLFADEILEYRIEKKEDGKRVLVREGRIAGSVGQGSGRFARLNSLIRDASEEKKGWQQAVYELGETDVLLKDYFRQQ